MQSISHTFRFFPVFDLNVTLVAHTSVIRANHARTHIHNWSLRQRDNDDHHDDNDDYSMICSTVSVRMCTPARLSDGLRTKNTKQNMNNTKKVKKRQQKCNTQLFYYIFRYDDLCVIFYFSPNSFQSLEWIFMSNCFLLLFYKNWMEQCFFYFKWAIELKVVFVVYELLLNFARKTVNEIEQSFHISKCFLSTHHANSFFVLNFIHYLIHPHWIL